MGSSILLLLDIFFDYGLWRQALRPRARLADLLCATIALHGDLAGLRKAISFYA